MLNKLWLLSAAVFAFAIVAWAAPEESLPAIETDSAELEDSEESAQLNFNKAQLDIVLEVYSKWVGKTILKDPGVQSPEITLKSRPGQVLSDQERLEAIEVVLEMHGVHLEPYGEKFIRAIPRKNARKDGIPLLMDSNLKLEESGKVVSMMISFKNISFEEAQKALEGFKSDSGLLQVFERTNSILVTDTKQNINRMLEIAKAIDIASPILEQSFVRQIKYANVNDIKTVLEYIVQESQKEQEKNGKGVENARNKMNPASSRLLGGPGNSLLRRNQPAAPAQPTSLESIVTSVSEADRGMIRGKVVMTADERSNKLLVITMKTNMDFFDKIIEQLDVATTPDVQVKVYRLKYADAEDVSDMINDLIGNASSSKNSSKQNQNQASRSGSNQNLTTASRNTTSQRAGTNQRSGESKPGELSKDNVTVLADKRINGLVVMARTEDIPTLEAIIESMDIKLSQVLIETVIIEVGLGDDITTGVDWMKQKNGILDRGNFMLGGGGGTGAGTLQSLVGFAVSNGVEVAKVSPAGSGLNYFMKSDKLDLAAVIQASKNDSRSKYVASPIVMTLDNKEAVINATRMQYLLKGFTSSGNSYSTIAVPDYEQKELGIEIKVTPKINPNGTVMLEVEEKYTQKGSEQTIKYAASNTQNGAGDLQDVQVPTTITREMSADVLLENGETVVFGGLTETSYAESETGIPILKDIPWIGKWLFGTVKMEESRTELLVFMTPYVMEDAEAAQAEARRRKNTMSDPRPWDDHGWSKSELADPVSKREEVRRLKDEWKKQDEEYKNEKALEQMKMERVKKLEERAAAEEAKSSLRKPDEVEVKVGGKDVDPEEQAGLQILLDEQKAANEKN
jgi:general secretion pathway protein D